MSTILIIEDRADTINMLARALGKEHSVVKALTGEKGLKRLEKGDIDLVILDLMLPGINGEEVLEKIRSGKQKSVKVLILTAAKIEGKIKGADKMLPKPLEIDKLRKEIDGLLK